MLGFEPEFYLLDGETREMLFEGYHIFNTVRNTYVPFIQRLVEYLQALGLSIITANCEYAGSQWEINYTPGTGMAGPDATFTFKNAVKELAHLNGYCATFMSKPFSGSAGSGMHTHVSLLDAEGRNLFGDDEDPEGISLLCRHFIAGNLRHARSAYALLAPTVNCIKRRRPHTFSPSNVSWGLEDRSALVRIKGGSIASRHVEHRAPTALANPYLCAAAILGAGLIGIEEELGSRARCRGARRGGRDEAAAADQRARLAGCPRGGRAPAGSPRRRVRQRLHRDAPARARAVRRSRDGLGVRRVRGGLLMRLYDYGPSANCLKARLVLGRLGIPCERVPVDIFAGETLTPEYLKRNPDGRTPVLELDDGTCLAESNAIALYLAEGSDLVPEDPVDRARVMQWLFFEQNRLEPNVGSARFWRLTGRADERPDVFARLVVAGEGALAALDRHLTGRDYLVGARLTLADLVLACYAAAGEGAGIDMMGYPAVSAWLARLEREGISTAVEPYPPNAMAGAAGGTVHG